jgi:3-hydroxypropanoate dehydrogenase
MGGFGREGVDREFFADGRWRSLVLINVGRPVADGYRGRLPRSDFGDLSRVV